VDWERWLIWISAVLLAVSSAAALVVHHERPRRVWWPIVLGASLGGVPIVAAVFACGALPGPWLLHALGIVCTVGALLGTAGCWLARLRSAPCHHPVLALAGTLVGALVGSVLCAATTWAAIAVESASTLPLAIAAGLVGSCATLGFQVGAGGNGPDGPARPD
jgi:hypothetical protein